MTAMIQFYVSQRGEKHRYSVNKESKKGLLETTPADLLTELKGHGLELCISSFCLHVLMGRQFWCVYEVFFKDNSLSR